MVGMAALLPIAAQAGISLWGQSQADKTAKRARQAAEAASGVQSDYLRAAGNVYQQGISGAEDLVRQYGDRGIGYLEPYMGAGEEATDYLSAFMTPEGQQDLRGVYEASPSYDILQDLTEEEARRATGMYAGQGMAHSGALTEELWNRGASTRLGDYRDWLGRYLGTGRDLANRGYGAAGQSSRIAQNVGTGLANLKTSGADYMGRLLGMQGSLAAAPIIAGQRADARATQAGTDYMSKLAGGVGKMDLSDIFRGGGAPTVGPTPYDPNLPWLQPGGGTPAPYYPAAGWAGG